MNKNKIKDHLGNEFNTASEMCKHYGISYSLFSYRIKYGWSLKDALEKKPDCPAKVYDHKGNQYKNANELCRAYGLHRRTYKSRIEAGMSQKDALETPIKEYNVTDCKGDKYSSIHEMCKHYGINQVTYLNRIKKGMSQEDALTKTPSLATKSITQYDHKGIKHESQKAMCDYWQIPQCTFNHRIKSGLSLEEALTLPLDSKRRKKYDINDLIGTEFFTRCGLKTQIISGKNGHDLKIKFEDGIIKNHIRLAYLKNGSISHPSLKIRNLVNNYLCFQAKYIKTNTLAEKTYYECQCKICGYKNILTPQQMIEHNKTHG